MKLQNFIEKCGRVWALCCCYLWPSEVVLTIRQNDYITTRNIAIVCVGFFGR